MSRRVGWAVVTVIITLWLAFSQALPSALAQTPVATPPVMAPAPTSDAPQLPEPFSFLFDLARQYGWLVAILLVLGLFFGQSLGQGLSDALAKWLGEQAPGVAR